MKIQFTSGLIAMLSLSAAAQTAPPSSPSPPPTSHGLTAVAGLLVGHDVRAERPTGCTVVLAESGAVAGVDVRGGAPGSRELALLDPVNTVSEVHGVVLAGGSAFGLDAASGVVRFLEERGVGFPTRVARVPIVPAAILYDLEIGGRPEIRPDAAAGYRAAQAATAGPVAEGNAGAGAGASVGKLAGMGRAMRGGLGTAAIRLPNGITVAALVAVNAVGDVIDPATGRLVAGVRSTDGRQLADVRRLVREGLLQQPLPSPTTNTTIGVVATDARLTKAQATKLAQMAHDGLARAISPAHTPWDGDTLFALATGRNAGEIDLLTLGALAAEVTTEAILRGVRAARGLPELPAARDLSEVIP